PTSVAMCTGAKKLAPCSFAAVSHTWGRCTQPMRWLLPLPRRRTPGWVRGRPTSGSPSSAEATREWNWASTPWPWRRSKSLPKLLGSGEGAGDGKNAKPLSAAHSLDVETQLAFYPLVEGITAQVFIGDQVGNPTG